MSFFLLFIEAIRKRMIASFRYFFSFSTWFRAFRAFLIGFTVEICRYRKCRWPFDHLHRSETRQNDM